MKFSVNYLVSYEKCWCLICRVPTSFVNFPGMTGGWHKELISFKIQMFFHVWAWNWKWEFCFLIVSHELMRNGQEKFPIWFVFSFEMFWLCSYLNVLFSIQVHVTQMLNQLVVGSGPGGTTISEMGLSQVKGCLLQNLAVNQMKKLSVPLWRLKTMSNTSEV